MARGENAFPPSIQDNIYELHPPEKKIEKIDHRIMRAADFWGIDLEDPNQIVPGLVPKHMITLFAGRAGNGKSYSCQILTSAAAIGREWFGIPVKQCKSLSIYTEDPQNELHKRQIKICEHYNIGLHELGEALIWPNDDGNFELFTCFRRFGDGTPRTLWLQVEEFCKNERVELLILDNASNVFGGDHNNAKHVSSFVRYFNSRARVLDAAIIITANPPKSREAYFSGNQKWEDASRNTLSLDHAEDQEGKDIPGELVLKVKKANYLAYNHPLKRIGITLEWQNDILIHKPTDGPRELDALGRMDLDIRVVKAVTHAVSVLGHKFAADPSSPNYLPGKLAAARQWQHIAWSDLVASVDRLLTDGKLIKVEVKDVWLLRAPDSQPYLGERK